MTIEVYGPGPSCQKCNATKRLLRKQGHEYIEMDTNDPTHAQFAKDLGHQVSPVVVVKDDDGVIVQHWSDHREDRVKGLVA